MFQRLTMHLSALLCSLTLMLPLATLPAAPAHGSEILAIAKDLKPGEGGLPPPLEKPLHISVCLFDILGKNGELYSRAKDLVLIARRWNVFTEIQVFTDERITAENFKAGQCDAAGISTLRARQFNSFIGTIDSVGAVPSYEHMRILLKTLLDPKLIPLSITEPYQIVGVLPVGALYVMVRDREINSIEKAAGKKIAVLDWDKSQAEMVQKLGAQPVASDITNFAGKFNNGQVDIIAAPAIAFRPMELYRGLGTKGAIYRFPLAQITGSLVINRDRLKQKLPDLDQKMLSLRAVALQFMDSFLDELFAYVDKLEKDIPEKYWMALTPEDEKRYKIMMREARIQMTKDGYYDPRMIKVLKKIRCKVDPANAECSMKDE
ncbi:MAG TPA: putative solute-binding protein [Fluviicoccus sp.]|nr:putative solute-binding protein [Fluviicoccus sp.]